MRVRWVLLPLIALLGFVACAKKKPLVGEPARTSGKTNGTATQQLIVTPETGFIGKVVWVNAEARFVVISFPHGQLPPLDYRLEVYRRGLKVGEVKISEPHRDDNIVADLVAGEAQKGDEVRDR